MRYLHFLILAGVVALASQPSLGDRILPTGKIRGIDVTKRKPFTDRDIGTVPIPDIMPDIDAWFRTFEPLHRKQLEELVKAQKAVRLNKKDLVYAWSLEWVENGFSAIALDDIDAARSVLSELVSELSDDIDKLKDGTCDECDGTKYAVCSKCKGKGKIEKEKQVRKYSPKRGRYVELKKVVGRCDDCKGRRKILCDDPIHEAEKYAKKIGGPEKMVEIEIAAKKQNLVLSKIQKEMASKKKETILKSLAEQCHRDKYYYIMLEILRFYGEQVAP